LAFVFILTPNFKGKKILRRLAQCHKNEVASPAILQLIQNPLRFIGGGSLFSEIVQTVESADGKGSTDALGHDWKPLFLIKKLLNKSQQLLSLQN